MVLQVGLAQRQARLWDWPCCITGVGTDGPGTDVGSWILSTAGEPRGLGRDRQCWEYSLGPSCKF